jgi:hypothetical protein
MFLVLNLLSQFTEAESNMQDLVAEYQQYQDATYVFFECILVLANFILLVSRRKLSTRKSKLRKSRRMMPMKPFFPISSCHVIHPLHDILCTTFTLPAPYDSAVVSLLYLFFLLWISD